MDEILRSGALDKLPPRHKEHHPHVKREDVELIVSREFGRADGHQNEELIVINEIRCTSWKYQNPRPKKHCRKRRETFQRL
jgi:hypothetical protein